MDKVCKFCNKNKDISNFSIKNRKNKKGLIKSYYSIYCKECSNLKIKLWRQKHPEKTKIYNKSLSAKLSKEKWLIKNKEKRRIYQQLYYKNNINKHKEISKTEKFKNYKKNYKNNKKKTDPVFRMRHNISNAILKALKKGKSNKAGQSILKYLGFNLQDLKNHLEKQFNAQMSWDNYGIYWHIDHIMPQSNFPYISMEDENFKKCWNLNNLRPLEAKQNMIDGAQRTRHKKSTSIRV